MKVRANATPHPQLTGLILSGFRLDCCKMKGDGRVLRDVGAVDFWNTSQDFTSSWAVALKKTDKDSGGLHFLAVRPCLVATDFPGLQISQ